MDQGLAVEEQLQADRLRLAAEEAQSAYHAKTDATLELLQVQSMVCYYLTSLETGSTSGLCNNNLMSIKVFPKLQKLILNGPETGVPFGDNSARLGKVDALTTLDCISDLELRQVNFMYNMFCQLATLTQLTRLRISSHMKHHNYQELDQKLANLSNLTRLDCLTCWFRRPAEQGPETGSYKDCGNSLRALRPQVYFDIWFQPYRLQ